MNGASEGSAWWHPERYRRRRPWLLARNRIQERLRQWFRQVGFIEVDPALLQRSPGNEAHLHALATELQATDGSPRDRLYLHTSPEFAMKKLLAAGERRIFAFTHCFRNREEGALHGCEFTMLEWYRAGQDQEALIEDCVTMLKLALAAAGRDQLAHGERRGEPFWPARRLSVAEAFARHADIDLLTTIGGGQVTSGEQAGPFEPDRDALAQAATACGIRVADDDSWSDIFSRVLVEKIEPALPDDASFLVDYPRPEAALARMHPDDPRLARRFELYACGVELANGFEELTDPVEQRARFEADMALKERLYGERYPIDEDLLAALELMPPTSGIALGFDRLVMLATGAPSVDAVMWTPPGG